MGRGVALAGFVLLGAACAQEVPAQRESDMMERSSRLLARLDQLEADLHDEEAKLGVYSVLGERHAQVTQMACQVSAEHVQEIHRLAQAQAEKQKERTTHRRGITTARLRTSVN